jgi:hypothetical protein
MQLSPAFCHPISLFCRNILLSILLSDNLSPCTSRKAGHKFSCCFYQLHRIKMTSSDINWFMAWNMRMHAQRHEHNGLPGWVFRKANSFAMDLPYLMVRIFLLGARSQNIWALYHFSNITQKYIVKFLFPWNESGKTSRPTSGAQ